MEYIKKGIIKVPESVMENKDNSYFYSVPYYGSIWAYSYNPIDFTPKSIIKYVGVYPETLPNADEFGSRGQQEHYMKSITYKSTDYRRDVFVDMEGAHTPSSKIQKFADQSKLMKQFIDEYTSK
jgi:hypothetical protein